MGQGLAIGGFIGFVILALPLLVLALVIIWTLRRAPRDPVFPVVRLTQETETIVHSAAIGQDDSMQDVGPSSQTNVAAASPASAATDAEPVTAAAPAQLVSAKTVSEETAVTASSVDDKSSVGDDKSSVGDDKASVARLYISEAQGLIESGNFAEAASRLRDAIGIAALGRLLEPHALARVELGDLFLRQGDPITACEQWQIARQLFHQMSRRDDGDKVDRRMLDNGCPSDWVLTDF